MEDLFHFSEQLIHCRNNLYILKYGKLADPLKWGYFVWSTDEVLKWIRVVTFYKIMIIGISWQKCDNIRRKISAQIGDHNSGRQLKAGIPQA